MTSDKKSINISRNNIIKATDVSQSIDSSLQLTKEEILDLIKSSVGEQVISLIEYELMKDD